MKLPIRALLLAATALTAFPALAEDAKPDAAKEKPTAAAPAESGKDFTIIKLGNDGEVKNSEVIDIWKGLFPGGSAPDFNSFDENIRQNVLRGVISEKLIYSEAVKAGVDKDPDVKKRVAAVEKQVVMQAFMEQKAKDLVTDEQLKAAYAEKQAAAKGQEEIKARHILVPTEEEAKKISEELKKNKGATFEKIAKEKSTDKGSGVNGGELGWFTKEKMVPAFADAAFKMKKGEISDPVKTDFGWHVIQVEDRRPLQIASFDDMKESLKNEVANKAVQTYVEGLLQKAEIKYYGPDGKEKPFNTSLTGTPPKDVAPAAGGAKPEDKKKN